MTNFLDGSQNLLREFTSEFSKEECWGYNRFYKLDHLMADGFLDSDNKVNLFNLDCFEIFCQTYKFSPIVSGLTNLY